MQEKIDFKALAAPFKADEIEWRVQRGGMSGKNPWIMAVCYITSRAVQQRLDNIVGPANWQNVVKPVDGGFAHGLSIKVDGEWITKWDGAGCTGIEPVKGGISDSLKRAAVQWGIGRYLYQLETEFAQCRVIVDRKQATGNVHTHKPQNGPRELIEWFDPELPNWALPAKDDGGYLALISGVESLAGLRDLYVEAVRFARTNQDDSLEESFVQAKDLRKSQIQKNIQQNANKSRKEVQQWLEEQCRSLSMVPNQSAVDSLHKTIKENLEQRLEMQAFDPDPLREYLKAQYQQSTQKLKGK